MNRSNHILKIVNYAALRSEVRRRNYGISVINLVKLFLTRFRSASIQPRTDRSKLEKRMDSF